METPLSPREFIKRFHLPQLVKISSTLATHQQDDPSNQDELNQTTRATKKIDEDSTGGNRLATLPIRRHELKDPNWTYAPGENQNYLEEEEDSARSGSKSLAILPTRHQHQMNESQASLAPVASSGTSLRMLPRVKLQQQSSAARRRLAAEPLNHQTFLRLDQQHHTAKTKHQRPSEVNLHADIKLMPPSKRPTLSKVHLEQPFLLYKAYRKLEICAFAMDANNELNDKSGDPIFFPHNYQGECMAFVSLLTS